MRGRNSCIRVRMGHRNHDGDAARAQVLLKREVPINREKRLEVLGNHKLQEFTVALGRPTQINDVMCVVAGQITQQRPRHTLIEQQSHALRSWSAPFQEPRLPVRE